MSAFPVLSHDQIFLQFCVTNNWPDSYFEKLVTKLQLPSGTSARETIQNYFARNWVLASPIDEFLAEQYTGPKTMIYSEADINNLNWENVRRFDAVLHLGTECQSLEIARLRILYILKQLGVLKSYLPILIDPPILEAICQNLSLSDLLQVRTALGRKEFNCPIPVNDPDHRITFLPKLNTQMLELLLELEEDGSDYVYDQAESSNNQEVLNILRQVGYNPTLISKITALIQNDYMGDIFYTRVYNVFATIGQSLSLIGDVTLVQEEFQDYRAWTLFDLTISRMSSYEYEKWTGSLVDLIENEPLPTIELDIAINLNKTSLKEAGEILKYFFPSITYRVILPNHIRISLQSLNQALANFEPMFD